MSNYLGRGIDQIDNISTLDNLSFNGSLQTFNLTQNSVAFVPVSADALQIQIDGVIQANNFTISGSTLTFDFVPSGSSVCNSVKHFGVGIITSVSDGAVTNVKLGADSVNGSKIADDSISDEHLDITAITGQTAITSLADTDKFLVSDASDSGNLKYVEKQYLGGGGLIFIGEVSATSEVTNLVLDNVFTSSYTNYLLVGEYTLANGSSPSARFKFRTGGSSGSDLSSSEYNYHFALGKADVGTYNSTRATGAASCEFTADTSNNQARVGIRLTWTVYDPFDNGKRTSISGHGKYTQSDGNSAATVGSCDYRTNDSVTGIKFYASNDNVYSGHFRVYGIVDS